MDKIIELKKDWLPTKTEIENAAAKIALPIEEGQLKPEQAAVYIDALKKIIATAEKKVKETIVSELYKYAKGEKINSVGCEIQPMDAGKWEYSNCGDSFYNDLCAEIEKMEVVKKEREQFLKTIKDKMMIVNEVTGELMEVRAPIKLSTPTYKIVYPK